MSIEEKVTEIHTLVTYWNDNGFPRCTAHTGRIERIEKDVAKHDKIIWGVATFLCAALAATIIGGCL